MFFEILTFFARNRSNINLPVLKGDDKLFIILRKSYMIEPDAGTLAFCWHQRQNSVKYTAKNAEVRNVE